jgi:hydroxyacylglutathione hydrolase
MNDDISINRLPVGSFSAKCYILGSAKTGEGRVVDPGGNADLIIRTIEDSRLKIGTIVLTHGHSDHIAALYDVQRYTGAAVAIHQADSSVLHGRGEYSMMFGISYKTPSSLDRLLDDNDTVEMGDIRFTVIHTPGHTAGSICLHTANRLFTGDTLVYRGIGTTFTLGSSRSQLVDSIESRLMTLPDDTILYPGHGRQTTIGDERLHNLRLNRYS